MNRHQLLKWAPLALALGLTGLTGAAQPKPQRYWLRESAAGGDVCENQEKLAMNMELGAAIGIEQADAEMSGTHEERYREEVLEVDANGAIASLRRTYTVSRDVFKDPLGVIEKRVSSLPGKTVLVKRRGLKAVVSVAKGKISAADQKDLARALEGRVESLLPGREVSTGETWTFQSDEDRPLPEEFGSGSVTCRFENIVDYAGLRCARIHVVMQSSARIAGTPLPVAMKLSGFLHHGLILERPAAMDLDGNVSIEGAVREGGRRLFLSGDGTLQFKASTRWLKVAGKPVGGGAKR